MSEPPYEITSACPTQGTLHVWRPHDTLPRHTSSNLPLASRPTPTRPPHCLLHNAARTSTTLATLVPHGPAHRATPPEPRLTALAASRDAALLAAGGRSGRVYVWQRATGDLWRAWHAHFRGVSCACFSDGDEVLVTGGGDGAVKVWGVGDVVDAGAAGGGEGKAAVPRSRCELVGHTLGVVDLDVGFAGTAARAVSVAKDRTARVWHLGSGRCVGCVLMRTVPTCVVMGVGEVEAYVGLEGGEVVVVEVAALGEGVVVGMAGMRVLGGGNSGAVRSIALSPGGGGVVVGYGGGGVKVFQGETVVASYDRQGGGAGGIEFVATRPVADGEEAREGPLATTGVPLKPAVDSALATKFRPVVRVGGGGGRGSAAAHLALSYAMEAAFEPLAAVCEGGGDGGEGGEMHANGEGVEADAGVREGFGEEEERLRKRIRELEEAGNRLVKLVEQSAR